MKTHILLAVTLLLAANSQAQEEKKYPSLPSQVFSTYTPKTPVNHKPETMAATATSFLSSLSDDLRKQAALEYKSPEKGKWTNVPPRGEQGGVRLGDLNETQLQLAFDLLAGTMSEQGYGKARNIPLADDRLLKNGERRKGFGAEDYWLAIFGKPSATEPWALQFDGHHIAINLAFHGDKMCLSPTFIGTQPATFELTEKTIEPMINQNKYALALMQSLSEDQQKQALMGDKRANLVAGAGRDGRIPDPKGLSLASLNEAQTKQLIDLISLYVGDLPKPYADKRMESLAKETKKMTFGWWGPVKENGDYSYRLQGPTLIIEYAGQNLGGDPSNHLHSMYRDPTNEYGEGNSSQ